MNGMKGICDPLLVVAGVFAPSHTLAAHPAVFGWHFIALIEHMLADGLGKHIKNS